MKKSELVNELITMITEMIKEVGDDEVSPTEFCEKIVDFFDKKGILAPTHFVSEGDVVKQVGGFEPEE